MLSTRPLAYPCFANTRIAARRIFARVSCACFARMPVAPGLRTAVVVMGTPQCVEEWHRRVHGRVRRDAISDAGVLRRPRLALEPMQFAGHVLPRFGVG